MQLAIPGGRAGEPARPESPGDAEDQRRGKSHPDAQRVKGPAPRTADILEQKHQTCRQADQQPDEQEYDEYLEPHVSDLASNSVGRI